MLALALGGGCGCPGSRVFAPNAGLSSFGGLYLSTGIFQLFSWLSHDGDVLCYQADYLDKRTGGGGSCFFESEEDCLEIGRAVPTCWVCPSRFYRRIEGVVAGGGLRPDGSDLTIDLASPKNAGFAYYDDARGYTVVVLSTLRNREVLQVVLPGRLSGTHGIYGTDGNTLEPGVALRVENTTFSTQHSERIALGEFTIQGDYPEVDGVLEGTLQVKLFAPDGTTREIAGAVAVPFFAKPEELTDAVAQN
jgi:hypothetical protein